MAKFTSSALYFDGNRRYKPGEVFDLPEGQKPGRGMVKVEEDKPKDVFVEPEQPEQVEQGKGGKGGKGGKARNNEPETFSEVAKADADAMGKDLNG
jgi:hypothetical protein